MHMPVKNQVCCGSESLTVRRVNSICNTHTPYTGSRTGARAAARKDARRASSPFENTASRYRNPRSVPAHETQPDKAFRARSVPRGESACLTLDDTTVEHDCACYTGMHLDCHH